MFYILNLLEMKEVIFMHVTENSFLIYMYWSINAYFDKFCLYIWEDRTLQEEMNPYNQQVYICGNDIAEIHAGLWNLC